MTPTLLTIAGTDPTGGAGLAADLAVFRDFGAWGVSVPTTVFDQDSLAVHARAPLEAVLVGAMVGRILHGARPHAIKVGVLYSAEIAAAVADALEEAAVPIVLDPVLASGLGDSLQQQGLMEVLRQTWLPLATVITPNVPEAEALLGRSIAADPAGAAAELASGGAAVLLKGGHLPDAPGDWLATTSGVHFLPRHERFPEDVHGTGCHLSSAVAALLALGCGIAEAVAGARRYLAACMGSARRLPGEAGGRSSVVHGDATRAAAREVLAGSGRG